MDYIDRIVAVREDADDTQKTLGEKLDIHPVQWANYERRANEMPIRYLVKFCQHYGVSADYILGLPKGLDWPRE